MSKLKWWPIITGETENPEDDKIIGFSVVKAGYNGITQEQAHTLSTKEVPAITGGAYSLLKENIDNGNWYRADGRTLCPTCEKEYRKHKTINYTTPILTILCNGDLVKL